MSQQSPKNPSAPVEAELQSESTVQDLQTQEDVKGGLLVPAVQKIREAAARMGGG